MGSDDETAPLTAALGAQAAAAGAALDALAAATRGELAPGAVIGGRFEVLRTLGAGGMGVVYAAYDPTLDRRVAVKVVRATRAVDDGAARLIREARAVATVSHANVIVVYDVGSTADGVFIAMEYLDGGTLREWLATPQPRAAIVARFIDAGRGLAAAHAAGLVHRDFKPDNVLLGRDGRVRVADFGLARRADRGEVPDAPSGDGLDPASRLTQAGAIVGTPAYMSPEQLAGAELDARSDQFAFAVALYQALYGEHPFAAVGARTAPVVRPPPAGADVPERLRAVLVRALAADRDARYPTMGALLAALDDRPRRHRRWIALAVVAAAGGAAAGALLLGGHRAAGPAPCASGPARVAAVWNPARSAALRRAFVATGVPQADAAWRGAVDALDDYGRRWALAHRDACLATRVRGEQSERLLDVRMACLDTRLADLDAVAGVLATADRPLVIDAVAAARRLPSVAACDEAAARRWLPALPDDPAVRAWVQAIEAQLAAARARLTAGRYAEGRALIAPVRVAAATLGERPLLADVLLVAGRLERAASDVARSRQTLAAGLRAATAGRHDAAAAELALEVMRGAIDLDYGDAVDDIVADAQAWVDRLADPRLAARLLDLRGSLALRRNDFAAARRLLRQALTTYRVETVDDPLVVASVLRRLSLIDQLEGDFAAADASGREAVDTIARALGPWHPEALATRSNLAVGLGDRGAWAASLAEHAAILALREPLLGPTHLDVAMSLYGIARAQLRLGRLAEAATAAARVLAIRAAVLPPDAIEIGEAHGMIGRIALAAGRAAEARPHFVTAAACYAAHLGLDHPARAVALGEQAAADLALGDAAAALATARAALALDVADYPAVRAELTLVVVQALTARGPAGVAEARPLAERARADFAAASAGERIGLPALEAWLAAHPPAAR